MNKKLQNAIRALIGDDPAQAVERVRANRTLSWNFLDTVFTVGFCLQNVETWFHERYGLAAYGGGLAAVITNGGWVTAIAVAATADAATRIAAMLWAAAWIVEVDENE